MIFSGNTTALGATKIPMAEGYDCSYGASLALVEAARNDFAMFQAMLSSDYKEMSICKESAAGYVQESEICALQEAVGGGIFKKIAELFSKLVAKIKAIFHTFMSKIRALYMKDKDLVKKYQRELITKKNIGNLQVKWRKTEEGHRSVTFEKFDVESRFEGAVGHSDDEWKRVTKYLDTKVADQSDSIEEYRKNYINSVFQDEDTYKLDEIGGIREVLNFISEYDSKLRTMQSNINKVTSDIEKLVKDYKTKESKAADDVVKATGDDNIKTSEDKLKEAREEYDMAQAYQTAMLTTTQLTTEIAKIEYKQNKAAFMKAIAANGKKLEESAIYAQAVAEAAEQEVEDVIGNALSDEEISSISAASTDVKDSDVSDCPNCTTYGPDHYTANATYNDTDGAVNTNINSREEAAFFGKLLY